MKNIILLTKTNIRRNKLALFLSVTGAVLLCLILYSIGDMIASGELADVSVGVIDYDNSALSEDFKVYMTENLHYNLLENDTYDELSAELIDKDISVIIEIPEDFYEKYASGETENIIVTSTDDFENAAFVQAYINNYLGSIRILSKAAEGNKESFNQLLSENQKHNITVSQTAAVEIDHKEYANRSGFINSVGFYLMFISAISLLITFMVLDDRNCGVYNRIQISPVKPIQYIVGTGVFGLFLCFLQIALYGGYIYVMDIKTGVPMYLLLLLMGLFSLFTVCFSLAIAVVMNSKNAMTSIVIGVSTIGCILGGAYFPIDLAPKNLQNLARVLPQYWFMDAFRRLQSDITANVLPNITILALFSILSLLIGAVMFSQNYKTN
jgi:ABC-2 type transport system permease protein